MSYDSVRQRDASNTLLSQHYSFLSFFFFSILSSRETSHQPNRKVPRDLSLSLSLSLSFVAAVSSVSATVSCDRSAGYMYLG